MRNIINISVIFTTFAIAFVCFGLNVFAATRLPHYFPEGMESANTISGQMELYLRYLNATNCFSTDGKAVSRMFNNSIRIEREVFGEKVIFIFDPWKRTGKGEIVFSDFCGQKVISQEEFDLVADDFIKQFVRAVEEINYPYYKDLEKLAVAESFKQKGKGLNEEEFRKLLDRPIPEDPEGKISFREINRIPPEITKASFVKHVKAREIHFGFISALGEVWLHSGVTYISLQGRILDYLNGDRPLIMAHEAIHANALLQNWPLSEGWDPELGASLPAMLLPDDKIYLSLHSYLKVPRELIHVFFGYNFEQVRKEVVLFDYDGNLRIDTEKFDFYAAKLEEAKRELLAFFREKAIPQFYSDPTFWTSLGEKLQDKNAAIRIMMIQNYEPTILGGNEETAKWLDTRKYEIMNIAEESYKESGQPSSGDKEGSVHQKFLSLAARLGYNQDDLLELAKKYRINVSDLNNKSEEELMRLFLGILYKENTEKGEVK